MRLAKGWFRSSASWYGNFPLNDESSRNRDFHDMLSLVKAHPTWTKQRGAAMGKHDSQLSPEWKCTVAQDAIRALSPTGFEQEPNPAFCFVDPSFE
jgi:hypothetical protein